MGPTRVTPPRLTPTAPLRVTLVQASVLENQLLSMQRNVVPQQIFACALAMDSGKPVLAQMENNSATLRTMNGVMVAIPAMVPLTVMILSMALLKLASLRTWTSVSLMDAVIT